MGNRRLVWAHTLADELRAAVIHDTHAAWFRRLGLDVELTLRQRLRGYVTAEVLYAYRTDDMIFDNLTDLPQLHRLLPRLKRAFPRLTDQHLVVVGLDPNDLSRYLGAGPRERLLGTVGELLLLGQCLG